MNKINFEQDQEEIIDKTQNINKLADKIKQMQGTLRCPGLRSIFDYFWSG